MFIQVMTEKQAASYRINPFDVTKVWSHKEFPRIEVGEVILNRNPENYFHDVEQAAFAPSAVVPGLGFSPDRMLQGRIFAYADGQRYRMGVNYHQIPVNRPLSETVSYHRDGGLRVDGNGAGSHNYHPNSFDNMLEYPDHNPPSVRESGAVAHYNHRTDEDYYSQAGDLYRLMNKEQKALLVHNIAGAVHSVPAFIQERQIGHFMKADKEYGEAVRKAISAAQAKAGTDNVVSISRSS